MAQKHVFEVTQERYNKIVELAGAKELPIESINSVIAYMTAKKYTLAVLKVSIGNGEYIFIEFYPSEWEDRVAHTITAFALSLSPDYSLKSLAVRE